MGWFPESGFINHDWMGYNEAMMLYILALGSPTHGVDPDAWTSWTRTYNNDWGVYQGQEYLSFGPLFGHQYSHVWIDFRDIQDQYMRERGIDYFLNSRRATLAQRDYAIDNPMKWKDYSENVWGLTASDGPQNTSQQYRGEQRQFRHYSSRGAGLRENFDDGTIVPSAAISSIVFAPEVVISATEEMHKRYGDFLYSSYGFLDSFNPSFNYDIPLKTGRMVPDRGWVASDYIAIDQGPILAMIANYQNEFVWNVMKKNPYIRAGLERAGFTGGWLTRKASRSRRRRRTSRRRPRALGMAESRAAAAQVQQDPTQRQNPSNPCAFETVDIGRRPVRRCGGMRTRRSGQDHGAFLGDGQGGRSGRRAGGRLRKAQPHDPRGCAEHPDDRGARKLLTAFAADGLPDVCQLGNTWLPEFALLDTLEPMQPYVARSRIVDPADYFPGVWDTNLVDGTLYGVPWYVDTRLLFYRKDLLREAGYREMPKTWAEMEQVMAAIKRKVGPDRFAILMPLNEFEQQLSFALQQDDRLLRDHDNYGNFRGAGFRKALGFYDNMYQKAGHRRSPRPRCPTSGTNSSTAITRSICPGRGTCANSSCASHRAWKASGAPRRCRAPMAWVPALPAAPAW